MALSTQEMKHFIPKLAYLRIWNVLEIITALNHQHLWMLGLLLLSEANKALFSVHISALGSLSSLSLPPLPPPGRFLDMEEKVYVILKSPPATEQGFEWCWSKIAIYNLWSAVIKKHSQENDAVKSIPDWCQDRKQCLILVVLVHNTCLSLCWEIVSSMCKTRFVLTFLLDILP